MEDAVLKMKQGPRLAFHGAATVGELLLLAATAFILFGLYAASKGQDANWDQFNYHFYAGHFLSGRIAQDIFPTGYSSYLNHVSYIPFHWLVTHLSPRSAGFVLGGLHGLNLAALYLVCRLFVVGSQPLVRIGLALTACLTGSASPMLIPRSVNSAEATAIVR